jgi:glycosyltransferase involved in cell wall biosynthesis
MISPTPTHPQNTGNRARIFQLSEQIRSFGCDLYFAYYPLEGGDLEAMQIYWGRRLVLLRYGIYKRIYYLFQKIIERLKKVRDNESEFCTKPIEIDGWYDSSIEKTLMKIHSQVKFSIVWVEYVYLSRILNQFDSSVHKVIDTHDVFSNRNEILVSNRIKPDWFSTTPNLEKKGLSRADIVIAIKDSEAEYFRSLGLPNVITIGHFSPVTTGTIGNKPNVLLFIASDNSINIMSWEYFIETMLELIKKRIPKVSVRVAGRICRCIPDSPDYEKVGVVHSLSYLYGSAKIAINPVTFGTGLKIKSIEPLAFGCPVVTTRVGIEGIEDAKDRGVLVGNTPEEFVDQIEVLIEDFDFYEEQSQRARQYMNEYNNLNRLRLARLIDRCAPEPIN